MRQQRTIPGYERDEMSKVNMSFFRNNNKYNIQIENQK